MLESVIRVRKAELRLSTVWTLDKFQQKLLAMRELYATAKTSADYDDGDEDVFFDPDDAWMADSPSSSETSYLLSPRL